MNTYLVGKFKTGSIQHQLVTGFDLFKAIDETTDGVFRSVSPLDLFNPVYGSPNPNNTRFSILTGEQRSRGIEFDIAGEILPGWNIIAAYAYADAIVTEDTRPLVVDNRLNNIPQHSFSLWTTYTLQEGALQGLGFGFGVFYVGDRQGDLTNTFELPSYLRIDAALFYKRNNFRAALNIKNLFDITYFESALSNLSVYPGTPLTVQGTIGWEF